MILKYLLIQLVIWGFEDWDPYIWLRWYKGFILLYYWFITLIRALFYYFASESRPGWNFGRKWTRTVSPGLCRKKVTLYTKILCTLYISTPIKWRLVYLYITSILVSPWELDCVCNYEMHFAVFSASPNAGINVTRYYLLIIWFRYKPRSDVF